MKKIFFISILCLLVINAIGQIPNSGFEVWQSYGAYEKPDSSWDTQDSLITTIGGLTVTKTSDSHSGSFAAKLYCSNSNIGIIFDGALLLGDITYSWPNIIYHGGIPFTNRPQTFDGFYKYTSGISTDSSITFVYLYKHDSFGGIDTIAIATGVRYDVSTYTFFSDTFTYFSNDFPDSCFIFLSATHNAGAPIEGSTLFIDDISLNGFVAPSPCNASFTMYPDSLTPHNWFALNQCSGTSPINYLWNWGDGNTSIGATPSHIYSSPGFYSICVTIIDGVGCTNTYCDSSTYIFKVEEDMSIATVNVVLSLPNGISNPKNLSEVSISPIPATNEIKISNLSQSENQIKIFNLLGQQVKSIAISNEQTTTINISDLPIGIYELTIFDGKKISCKKLMKE